MVGFLKNISERPRRCLDAKLIKGIYVEEL
jgi:hypothetical protein